MVINNSFTIEEEMEPDGPCCICGQEASHKHLDDKKNYCDKCCIETNGGKLTEMPHAATSSEFKEIVNYTVRKHKIKNKIILFSITVWVTLIGGIETVVFLPPLWIAIPLIMTCVMLVVIFLVFLIRNINNMLYEIKYERSRERNRDID